MQFWKQKKRCHIQGKDFSKNLLFTIKRSGASSVEGFLSWLTEWKDTEVEKLSARKRDYAHVTDKYEVLVNLSDDCNTLDELKNNIRNLFDDVDQEGAAGTITASTTHKYKGMEADRVWMLNATYKPGKGQEEDNLVYVAMTRSKDSLFFVGGGPIISDAVVAEGEAEVVAETQV
jgi:superfamily I DNA/RNA helicase